MLEIEPIQYPVDTLCLLDAPTVYRDNSISEAVVRPSGCQNLSPYIDITADFLSCG